FHPDDAMPWNVIVCCKQDISITRLFSTDEIRASLSRYESMQKGMLFKKIDKYEYSNHPTINIINNESERIGRNPYCRIVVRTNAGSTASQR
ncbi:MAG: hypothetical protein LBN93_09930, partial [Candidatus Symbiothrix sp.]|nr:hypothetical protein [Candidatus Symbiothrix sp.]